MKLSRLLMVVVAALPAMALAQSDVPEIIRTPLSHVGKAYADKCLPVGHSLKNDIEKLLAEDLAYWQAASGGLDGRRKFLDTTMPRIAEQLEREGCNGRLAQSFRAEWVAVQRLVAEERAAQAARPKAYTVTLGQKMLAVPPDMLRFGPPESATPSSLYLELFLPGYDYSPENRQRHRSQGGHGDRLSITVYAGRGNLENVLASLLEVQDATRPVGMEYDLQKPPLTRPPRSDPRMTPHRERHVDLYFRRDGEEVLTVIECTPNMPSPSCMHSFRADGYRYGLRYAAKYLPQWKEIEKRMSQEIEKLVVKP